MPRTGVTAYSKTKCEHEQELAARCANDAIWDMGRPGKLEEIA